MKKVQVADHIFTIENFFTPQECQEYINLSEQIGYEAAKVNIDGKQVMRTAVRNNERVLYKNEQLERKLWQRVSPFIVPTIGYSNAIGLNEMFRFYKYTEGQRFKSHIDGSHVRNEKEASFYTLMVYLNDNYEGGSTKFHNNVVEPKTGNALIFLHKLRHEGKTLLSGTKYVLRTDIMYRLKK